MSMPASRFLVIGGSGLIGRRFLRAVGPGSAVGTYRSQPFAGGVPFDLGRDRADDLLHVVGSGFSHALVLAGEIKIDACAADPEGTAALNVHAMIALLDGLAAAGLRVIYASSDGVYDGRRPFSRETDEIAPVLTYGRQKRAVESHLLSAGQAAIILRIAKVLDPELTPSGILGPWIQSLVKGETLSCAVDQFFTPVGVADVVSAAVALAAAGAEGLFNVGGPERLSRLELLAMLATRVARYHPVRPTIAVCGIGDFPFTEPRPLDTSVAIDRLRATLPYHPLPPAALCDQAARRFFREDPKARSIDDGKNPE